tara:strand:- start:338 stop:1357 length:1020 start_codon:yes stop_codon:yes gene_type:complete
MGRCSVGRSTQKYTGGGSGGADLSSILTVHGDMIYANVSAEAANVSIGQTTGHVLTVIAPGEVGWQGVSGASGQVGTLQSVTTNASTTDIETGFLNTVTSLTASGNVLVTGNVTADTFYGSGVNLTGIALATDLTSIITNLSDNSSRISNIETSTIGDIIYSNATDTLTKLNIGQSGYVLQSNGVGPEWVDMSSTSGLPTPYTHGDILYATGTNTLAKLNIGTSGQVLKSDGTVPVWGTDVSSSSGTTIWTDTGVSGKIHYSSGNVGINTSTPTTDLQIGSNVNISDTNDDKLVITGNVYVSRNLRVIDEIKTFSLTTTQLLVKTVEVTAVRQSRNLVI